MLRLINISIVNNGTHMDIMPVKKYINSYYIQLHSDFKPLFVGKEELKQPVCDSKAYSVNYVIDIQDLSEVNQAILKASYLMLKSAVNKFTEDSVDERYLNMYKETLSLVEHVI